MLAQILTKTVIKANLPQGSLSEVANIMKARYNRPVSISKVKDVCNPMKTAWDQEIIEVAQAVIITHQQQRIAAISTLSINLYLYIY